MKALDRQLLRELADWSTGGLPVTSVYLDVDGRRYPRRADYLVRLEDLLRKAGNGSWSKEVAFGLEASGVACTSCGHLAAGGERCAVCGGDVEEAPDLVEEAIELALRQRCEVETVQDVAGLTALGGIGALHRF